MENIYPNKNTGAKEARQVTLSLWTTLAPFQAVPATFGKHRTKNK